MSCEFICGVAGIDTPQKLLDYDRYRLALELHAWLKYFPKNPFDHRDEIVNLDFCEGLVFSWYLTTDYFFD